MTAGRRTYTQRQLLEELEPVVAKELDRHLNIAKEWMPHEYVPWTEGMNFAGVFEDGVPWDVSQSKVSETARTALVVNLLTEDNLPSYHREISQSFGPAAPGVRGSAGGPPRRAGTAWPSATTCSPAGPSTPTRWSASAWCT